MSGNPLTSASGGPVGRSIVFFLLVAMVALVLSASRASADPGRISFIQGAPPAVAINGPDGPVSQLNQKYEPLAHADPISLFSLGFGVMYGIITAMAVLSLFLFLFLRDWAHFWYLISLLFLLAYFFIGDEASLIQHLAGGRSWNLEPLYRTLVVGLLILFTQFSRSFLLTGETAPKADKLLLLLILFYLASGLFSYVRPKPVYLYIFPVISFISPFVSIGIGIFRLKRGFRPARFFILGLPFFTLGGIAEVLAGSGMVASTALTQNGLQIGSTMMVILFSLAQVDRMRTLSREKEAAETAFQALFDQTFQYMWLLDSTGMIKEINETALECENNGKHDIIGRFFPDLDFWRDVPEAREELILAVEQAGQGRFVRLETTGLDREGRRLHLDVSLKPVKSSDDRILLLITEGRDITDLKKAQQQVFQSEKLAALGRLAAGVAHEINNPNNFIYFNLPVLRDYLNRLRDMMEMAEIGAEGSSYSIEEKDEIFADIIELLADMEHGSARITRIVSEFRDYLKGREGEPKKTETVKNLIERVLSLAGGQVRRMVKRIEVDIPEDPLKLFIQTARIEQVAANLLLNAAQASDKVDSWIKIKAGREKDSGMVYISVEDNGSGIPEEAAPRIFEPFFTTREDSSGTGQGLAISRKIMEDHGGEITFSSRPEHGTLFTLKFPLQEKENQ